MNVRPFDPARDTVDDLVRLWNASYHARLWTPQQFQRLERPENLLLVEHEGHLVAGAFLLDGGGPFVLLDAPVVIQRRFVAAATDALWRYVVDECRHRGVGWFYGILTDTSQQRQVKPTEYLGERPMFCRAVR